MDNMTPLAIAIGLLIGSVVGTVVGRLVSNAYVYYLDEHVPDWYMRPWWRCWWPRG